MSRQFFIDDGQVGFYADLLDFQEGELAVVGYTTASCRSQEIGQSHSLQMQRHAIVHTLQGMYGDNFRVIWISEIRSGKRCSGDDVRSRYRPGLHLAAKLIEAGVVQHICVTSHSRISRDPNIYYDFLNLVHEHKVNLISAAKAEATALSNCSAIGSEQVDLIIGMHLSGRKSSEIAEMLHRLQEDSDECED